MRANQRGQTLGLKGLTTKRQIKVVHHSGIIQFRYAPSGPGDKVIEHRPEKNKRRCVPYKKNKVV
jgi:hypothetical protein